MPHDAILRAVTERIAPDHEFVQRLVDIGSPTEDKALTDQVGDFLEAKAASIGMTCARDPQGQFADNRICRMLGGAHGAKRVLLVGHFDTVYAAGTARDRPFRIDGGFAFGPGVLDMKGGLAVGLFALEALRATDAASNLDLTFIFNSDEEIGSPASRRIIFEEAAKHDIALVLEPGRPGPAVTIGRKGVGIFKLRIDGIEAHAGIEPEKGVNSIVEMAHRILAIDKLNDLSAGTTVTVGVAAAGTKPYVVPGHAELSIRCRVSSRAERERISNAMTEIAAHAWNAKTTARLSGGFHRPPMEIL